MGNFYEPKYPPPPCHNDNSVDYEESSTQNDISVNEDQQHAKLERN